MNEEELYPDESRSLEDLRHMRLTALLRDMIEGYGKVRAAEFLGVNYRTLDRAEESGQLTRRMADALEKHLLLGGGSAAAQQWESIRALEKRVEALDEKLGDGLQDLRGVIDSIIDGFREEQAQGMRRLERRLAALESARDDGGSSEEDPKGMEETGAQPSVKPAWRPYRDVVTQEPEPGEEQVYGDAAPLIVEWRGVSAEFMDAGDALSKAVAEERLRELEIRLIEDHKLTLPPSTYPWDSFDRRSNLWTRKEALSRARVERARAEFRRWLRRVLTLRLWGD